ncbi:MAG: hypothetical protein R2819_03510 [Allomuricauda sp.]
MLKNLIFKSFEKARELRKEKGDNNPSMQALAEDISEFGSTTKEFNLGEKSFRDYFNEAKRLKNNTDDISIKQLDVINGLCKFLGYDNYKKFVKDVKADHESIQQKLTVIIRKNKVSITLLMTTICVIIIVAMVNRQRWMIWDGNHYIEAKFDAEKLQQGLLKVYKEDRIKYFEKITPDCDTQFFTEDGMENLWYGKNSSGELEYFTDLARHPETNKSLNPITRYMIKKYICESYP